MVATCKSNENGRFSTKLGLAELSLEVKSKMLFFLERQNYFEEKNTGCLYSCYGLAMCKRGAKLSFQVTAQKFVLYFSPQVMLLYTFGSVSRPSDVARPLYALDT